MTKTKNKGKKVYRSVAEFEKRFFPKSRKKSALEKPVDAQSLGASLAQETLEKLKRSLIGKLPN